MNDISMDLYNGSGEYYDHHNEYTYQPAPDKFGTVEEFTEWCRQDG